VGFMRDAVIKRFEITKIIASMMVSGRGLKVILTFLM